MRRPRALAVTAALVLAFAPAGARTQDLEAVAAMRGVALPAAYYEQVAADSTAYRFRRALFRRALPAQAAATGAVLLPVVLTLFSDSPAQPHVTRDRVEEVLFTGPAPRGTLTDAYADMSGGVLQVGGDVFPWVRSGHTLAEVVGANDGLGNDGSMGAHFVEALDSLDAGVDFARYDSDGPDGVPDSGDDDGFVDVITFEYLEVAASCGGPAIWPHRWTLTARTGTPYVTDDVGADGSPIRIDDYITQSATDCSGQGVQDASTMAHEFGHALGLPDYYHWIDVSAGPRGRRWVLGCWGLMAAGSWGCGPVVEPPDEFGPTHLTAHSKHELGWIDYRSISEVWNHEVLLDPVQTSLEALRVPLDEGGDEYLIAEYRTRAAFDGELPAGGVVLYKLDLSASLRPNPASGAPYRLRLLERDADDGLLRTDFEGGDRGAAGDVWGAAGAVDEVHALSSPALTRSDGSAAPVTVHELTVAEGRARLVISTARTPLLVPPPGAFDASEVVAFVEGIRIAGGTMPYTAMGTAPAGVTIAPDADGFTVTGAPTDPADLFLWVRDAAGRASDPLSLSGSGPVAWRPSVADLVRALVGSVADPLSTVELDFLDGAGNANGVYDVGDLRRWLNGRRGP